MVVDRAKIEQLEMQLEEARSQLLREDGQRYQVIMREISESEKQRILGNLTDKRERILFGLEAPASAQQPGKSGGDLVCDLCGKGGLTKRGLALHKARVHKGETSGLFSPTPPWSEERAGETEEVGQEAAETGSHRRR